MRNGDIKRATKTIVGVAGLFSFHTRLARTVEVFCFVCSFNDLGSMISVG